MVFPVISGDIFRGINIIVKDIIVGRLGATTLTSVSISNVGFIIIKQHK